MRIDMAGTALNDAPPLPWKWLAGLSAVFTGVHAVYYLMGVRYDAVSLIEMMHYLDPLLLRTRLLESLFYLHIQPPLMNLLVGLVLKVTPESVWLFQAIFLGFGLLLYECVFLIQVRLGIGRKLAAVLSTLFMASPPFILWEHFLLYTLPCAALLALAAVILFDVLHSWRWKALAAFFLALFLVCGLRSMFHLGFLVLALAGLLLIGRGFRRRILIAGLIPVLLLGGFYMKNRILFGEFTACTFVEKNLWIMTTGNMNGQEKVRLVREGTLSPFALINRWASMDAWPAYKEVPDRFADIPALAETHKSNGAVNYNHYGNIEVCNIYGRDAKYVLRHYPESYLYAVILSSYRYFISSSSLPVTPENRQALAPVIWFYDHVFFGKSPVNLAPYSRLVRIGGHPPYLLLLFGLPLLWLHGMYRVIQWRPGLIRLNFSGRIVICCLCFIILMVAVLGCAFDFHETARYRFMTDGFYLVLLGLALHAAGAWYRRSIHGKKTQAPAA
jgi:hypothetical protein